MSKSLVYKKWQTSAISLEISDSNLETGRLWSKIWSIPDYLGELTALLDKHLSSKIPLSLWNQHQLNLGLLNNYYVFLRYQHNMTKKSFICAWLRLTILVSHEKLWFFKHSQNKYSIRQLIHGKFILKYM